jgi:D-xylose transport system substrate-binding protein
MLLGIAIIALTAATVVSGATAHSTALRGHAASQGTVALLLPSLGQYRWDKQDRPDFINELKSLAPGAKVLYSNAEDSPTRQLQQAQAAITNGAKVLVLSPVNDQDATKIAQDAKAANVQVIAYARPIKQAPINYFVGLDLYQTGVGLGKFWAARFHAGEHVAILKGDPGDSNVPAYMKGLLSVLDPIAASGKIKIVADVFTPQWSTANAEREMDQILTQQKNNVQIVIPLNNSLALGVIASLERQRLPGKEALCRRDAAIPALQNILRGTQTMSTYFPISAMADQAAKITAALLAGQTPAKSLFNTTLNNGLVTVPGFGVGALSITKDNISRVISDGTWTKSQICTGIAKGVGPC